MPGEWIYAAIIGLVVIHLVALRYAYRQGRDARDATAESDPDEFMTDHGVECPQCNALNDSGYRYCRRCVSELPSSMSFFDSRVSSQRRQTF